MSRVAAAEESSHCTVCSVFWRWRRHWQH